MSNWGKKILGQRTKRPPELLEDMGCREAVKHADTHGAGDETGTLRQGKILPAGILQVPGAA